MAYKDCYRRDGYDLQYDRSVPSRLPSPQGFAEEQPNDPEIDEIIKLENTFRKLVGSRNSILNTESRILKVILDEALFLFKCLKSLDPASILNTSPDVFLKKDFIPRRDAFNERDILQ
jgi:hypothetical protein